MSQRALLLLAVVAALNIAAGRTAEAADAGPGPSMVYAAIGPELREYELDPASASLSHLASVTLPQNIQAGFVSSSGRYLYVAWSDATNKSPGSRHGLSTFSVDPISKRLLNVGGPLPLGSRPIYVSSDRAGRYLFIAYTDPSGVTVHRIARGGRVAAATPRGRLRLGVYAHQVVVAPSNRLAILVSRGNIGDANRREDPGALDVFTFENGVLKPGAVFAPHHGAGFHPRYVDLDPYRRWAFVSLSQRNALGVYELPGTSSLEPTLLSQTGSLAVTRRIHAGQLTGAVHVHPGAKFVYMVNRVLAPVTADGKEIFTGGEDDIAVFQINRRTSRPALIQNVDTHGLVPGEFAFDPGGGILVLANMQYGYVRDGQSLQAVPPSLALFRVHQNGKLDFIRKYDVVSGTHTLFWMGVGHAP